VNHPTVNKLVDGFVYRWQEPDFVEIEISDITYKSGDWMSYLIARTRAPGALPHLMEGRHNLSALQSRTALAKSLEVKYQTRMGWSAYLEMACVLTMRAEREGDPFIEVGALEYDTPPLWLMTRKERGFLRLHAPNSIFGDGDAGKSTLAALIGCAVAGGIELVGFNPVYQGPVLWLDWENDKEDLDDTLKSLRRGHDEALPTFIYRRETWPLTQTVKQIVREVERSKVALVVIDSVGYAMGDDPESAAAVLRFTQCVRALNTTVLMIDHVKKGGSDGKAFGSAYKHNEVRSGYELLRHQKPGDPYSIIGIYQRKANKGGYMAPFGLRVDFEDGLIRYSETDIPNEAEELVKSLSVPQRIKRVLGEATGLMNADEIADLAEVKIGQVKSRLSEMERRGEVYVTRADGYARRYGLKSDRVEVHP